MAESEKLLKWRRRQKRGAIMSSKQFKEIERDAAASGASDPAAVAGKAYWNTARKKFRERKK